MPRLLFEKTGNAVWMSHLDLMRLFQRAFKRAGLPLTHTQGFNPRPSVSIALPLSVGVESVCELLDFDLDGEMVSCDDICQRLNSVLVDGVKVLQVAPTGRKLKELTFLHVQLTMEYDNGVPVSAMSDIQKLFQRDTLTISKRSKNGIQEQDIIPLIRSMELMEAGEKELVLRAVICCQNPSLNPMQLSAAIAAYLPEIAPDFVTYRRLEIFDETMNVFR